MTHSLFAEVLSRHQVRVEAARITGRKGQLFSAEIETAGPRGRQVIACRPSDALALVLRQRFPTPVLVAEWVYAGEEEKTS
jgi:bifunctional DNase/RNase